MGSYWQQHHAPAAGCLDYKFSEFYNIRVYSRVSIQARNSRHPQQIQKARVEGQARTVRPAPSDGPVRPHVLEEAGLLELPRVDPPPLWREMSVGLAQTRNLAHASLWE